MTYLLVAEFAFVLNIIPLIPSKQLYDKTGLCWTLDMKSSSNIQHFSVYNDLLVRIPLKPWFFQASSFQLLKLENLLRWSFFTLTYDFKGYPSTRYQRSGVKDKLNIMIVYRPNVSGRIYPSIRDNSRALINPVNNTLQFTKIHFYSITRFILLSLAYKYGWIHFNF